MKQSNELKILLVEDNPHDAEMTLRAIERCELADKVVWVKDGAEALDLLLGEEADGKPNLRCYRLLLLLDLKLPKVNGLEVLRRLRSDERTRLIPVVVFTSSIEEQDNVRSYGLGVNSYIVKPVNSEDFSDAVVQCCLYWLSLNQPPPVSPDGEPRLSGKSTV